MIAQGVLRYQYELEKHVAGMTAVSGLPIHLDLLHVAGVKKSVARHVKLRTEGNRIYLEGVDLRLLTCHGGDLYWDGECVRDTC